MKSQERSKLSSPGNNCRHYSPDAPSRHEVRTLEFKVREREHRHAGCTRDIETLRQGHSDLPSKYRLVVRNRRDLLLVDNYVKKSWLCQVEGLFKRVIEFFRLIDSAPINPEC